MKIVDLKTFVGLPSGTLFHEYVPCVTGPLTIKYDTVSDNDWYEEVVDGMPESSGSDQLFDRLDEMLETGVSHPLDAGTSGRHGLYPSDGLFLVYEQADVRALVSVLTSDQG